MTTAELGVAASDPRPIGSRQQSVHPLEPVSAPIAVTYNPSTGSCTCNPTSVTIGKGNSGVVKVTLALSSGAGGSIAFDGPPINWTNGAPEGATVAPSNGGGTQITITDPNSSPGSYAFTVNYVYTPPSGSNVTGTGDPTIINEGTSKPGDGDDDRQEDRNQDTVHRH